MKQEKLSIFDMEEPISDLKGIGLLVESLGHHIDSVGVSKDSMSAFSLIKQMIDDRHKKLEKIFDSEVERQRKAND